MAKKNLHSALALLSGTALAQLIGVLASPLLTRLYSPAEFGIFSVYTTVVTILCTVGCLRYELAVMLPRRSSTALLVLKLCLRLALLSAIFSAVIIVPAHQLLGRWFDFGDYSYLLLFAPLSLGLAASYQALSSWSIRQKNYKQLAWSKTNQSIPQTLIQLSLGLTPLGAAGLVAGEVTGRLLGVATLLRSNNIKRQHTRGSSKRMWQVAAHYKDYPLFSSGSALLNQAALLAPTFFISTIYGAEAAGWYALVVRLLALPMDLIAQTILTIYMAEASSLWRERSPGLRKLMWKTVAGGFAISVVPALLLIRYGENLFGWVFGSEWQSAGRFAGIMAIAFMFRFAISPISQTLNMLGGQKHQLLLDAVRLIAITAIFLFNRDTPIETVLLQFVTVLVVSQIAVLIMIDNKTRRVLR